MYELREGGAGTQRGIFSDVVGFLRQIGESA